jgi:hypothetical protein
LFTFPSVCFPSYLVQLTNGSQFVVDHYWDEGHQIVFHSHGGAIGIPKSSVNKIQESDAIVESQIDTKPIILSPKAPHTLSTTDNAEEKTNALGKGEIEPISFELYKKMKELLKAEQERAIKRFREASSQTRVSGQLVDLTNQFTQESHGGPPGLVDGTMN